MTAEERPELLGPEGFDAASRALVQGAVVGVPTDTVYGLAVRLEAAAVDRVFSAKGRPSNLALPVLLAGLDQLSLVVASFPPIASALAARFWPGPLTLVVRARRGVGALLGGDGRTVGVRWPDQALTEELCRAVGPLAVTSANRHGEAPATTAQEVCQKFSASEVVLVVDGGPSAGVASSVVECTGRRPRCLREGALSWHLLESALPA